MKKRPYVGVDLLGMLMEGNTRAGAASNISWECWERCLMGFKPSPYNAMTQASFARGEEIIQGDRKDEDNPMRWD
jgi:hypothetical protein